MLVGDENVASTVCPRSSDPIYIVSYYIKWVTTSWTHSTKIPLPLPSPQPCFVLSFSPFLRPLLSIREIIIYHSHQGCPRSRRRAPLWQYRGPWGPCCWCLLCNPIEAIGNKLLKTFWSLVIGCVLRRPAYFVTITQLLPHPGHE